MIRGLIEVGGVLKYDFQSSIGYWICMTSHLYDRALNLELTPQGVTRCQCQILGWLALEGELSQVELANRMNVEPPTLVPVLDRMERDGLLAREACASDRRRNIVTAKPKAQIVWKKIVASSERVRAKAVAGLTPEQTATLKELLQMVQENLNPQAAGQEPAPAMPRVSRKGSRI